MALPVYFEDSATGKRAKVTPSGQLVVGSVAFDETKFIELAVDNIAYNFYAPRPKQHFVITVISAKADRDVSNSVDATVVIYEAGGDTATTVDKVLHQEAMIRGEVTALTRLNIKVAEGKWVNAKTSDDDIHMTIMGYYVDI